MLRCNIMLIGLVSLCLTGCDRLFLRVECPAIPAILTEPCQLPANPLETNGDLSRAVLEARVCLREEQIKLAAIASLASCRGTPD